jgi:hypothetical protein
MTEIAQQINPGDDHDNIGHLLLGSIRQILLKLSIKKVYFVDDAINLSTTDKATFIGLVQSIITSGDIEKLREINIQNAIDFNTDNAVLIDHINEVWDNIKPAKQLKYYKKAYTVLGQPEAINDLNVSSHLKDFFYDGILECLTPTEWDEKCPAIIEGIEDGQRVLVLFDQDLKLAQGRFSEQGIQGEDLILELKTRNIPNKVIIALFTHTITEYEEELPKRQEICDRIHALTAIDFFVLAKSRLEKHELFADGLKKTCLNTFCEKIKIATIEILKTAQENTINKLLQFDTYDFDHTVFKSSFTEGLWEPETLLRITDVIFKDEVRTLMKDQGYVPSVNSSIYAARDISNIEFNISNENVGRPYSEKYKLRYQEIYESEALLNQLRRPIDNGDIFIVTDGEGQNKKYILVAQECDLMIRSEGVSKGKRGARSATLLEIGTFTEQQLYNDIKRLYEGQIEKKKFSNHFYADKFKLDYFEHGTTKTGIAFFSKTITIDLNILDLIVFNETGEAVLDLADPAFDENFHNFAWRNRFKIISEEFTKEAEILNSLYLALEVIEDANVRKEVQLKINRLFSFISKTGIQINYNNGKFNFGIKRISRLRLPKSKNLLDRYYQHLSRFAELHDFAFDGIEKTEISKGKFEPKQEAPQAIKNPDSVKAAITPKLPNNKPEG